MMDIWVSAIATQLSYHHLPPNQSIPVLIMTFYQFVTPEYHTCGVIFSVVLFLPSYRYNSAAVTYSSFLSTPPLFYLALNLQLSRVHFTATAGEGGVNQVAGDKFNHPLPRHPRIKQEAV